MYISYFTSILLQHIMGNPSKKRFPLEHRPPWRGLQKDASGHSVLWHAIAFGHWGRGNPVLKTVPDGDGERSPRNHEDIGRTMISWQYFFCIYHPKSFAFHPKSIANLLVNGGHMMSLCHFDWSRLGSWFVRFVCVMEVSENFKGYPKLIGLNTYMG